MSWAAENWPVIGGFAAGLIAWGKTLTDVAKTKEEIKVARTDINELKDSMARIETHQQYTVKGIDEIRDELRSRR